MTSDEAIVEQIMTQFGDDAAAIRALGMHLAPLIAQAAALLRAAHTKARTITICGNRLSGALAAAAGLDYGVYLPPGQAGDVLLVIMPHDASDDLHGVIAAARGRGLCVVALLAETALALAAPADLLLPIPGADLGAIRLNTVAVLRVLALLL